MIQTARFTLLALIILLVVCPTSAMAWGSKFEDAVLGTALDALPGRPLDGVVSELDSWGAGSTWDEGWTGVADETDAVRLERALTDLTDAFRTVDRPQLARALRRLATTTGNLWQPLHAAGMVDAEHTLPGFHFRYETILAGRVDGDALEAGRPRLIVAPRLLATATSAARARLVPALEQAEERALQVSEQRFDSVYYDELWTELGDDLHQAANDAAQTLADLIYTAWIDGGEPQVSGSAPAASGLILRSVAPNPISTRAELKLDLRQAGEVRVDLYDVSGRFVRRLADEWFTAGEHLLTVDKIDTRRPAAGVYFLRVTSPAGMDWRKITLLY